MQVTSRIAAALMIGVTFGVSGAAVAQTPVVNTANLATECAKSAALCKAAVDAAIAALKTLGLTPTQLNTQLGVLAGAALSGAKNLPAAEKLALSGTLTSISNASTNSAQKLALTQLASQFASGSEVNLAAFAQAISAN